jgi:hypothetical protein
LEGLTLQHFRLGHQKQFWRGMFAALVVSIPAFFAAPAQAAPDTGTNIGGASSVADQWRAAGHVFTNHHYKRHHQRVRKEPRNVTGLPYHPAASRLAGNAPAVKADPQLSTAYSTTSASTAKAPHGGLYTFELGTGNDAFAKYFGNPLGGSDGGGFTGSFFAHGLYRPETGGPGWVAGIDGIGNTPQRVKGPPSQYGGLTDPVPYSGSVLASFGMDSGPGNNAYAFGGFVGANANLQAFQNFYHKLVGAHTVDWSQNPGGYGPMAGMSGWFSRELLGADLPFGSHAAFVTTAQGALGAKVAVSRFDADMALTLGNKDRLPVPGGQAGTLADPASGIGFKIGAVGEINPVDPALLGGKYKVKEYPLRFGLSAMAQAGWGPATVGVEYDALSPAYAGEQKPHTGPLSNLIDQRAVAILRFTM